MADRCEHGSRMGQCLEPEHPVARKEKEDELLEDAKDAYNDPLNWGTGFALARSVIELLDPEWLDD